MEVYYGIYTEYSGKSSDKYIEINNFGYYKNIDKAIPVTRKDGRPDWQLIYVKSGKVDFLTEAGIESAPTGTLILFRPHEKQIYTYSPEKDSEYFWIHFSGTGADEVLAGLFDENQTLFIDDSFEFSDAFQNLKSFCIKYDDAAIQFAAGCFIKMTAELKRRITRSDSMMEKVIEAMHNGKINSLSNEDYARMCGISEYHFIRRFKAFTGMSPHKYKTKLIINRGADLLQNTSMNIAEIAYSLGFEDSLYFSRAFKKATGFSPIAYRNHSR